MAVASGCALAGAGLSAGGTPVKAWRWTSEAIVDAVAIREARISRDGRSVAFARTSVCPASGGLDKRSCVNVWDVDSQTGAVRRRTEGTTLDGSPRPGSNGLVFLSRPVESPRTAGALLVAGPPGSRARELASDVLALERSPDEGRLASLRQMPSGRELWIHELATGQARRLLFADDASTSAFAWAPDSGSLVVSVGAGAGTSPHRLVEVPIAGASRTIVPLSAPAVRVAWSTDRSTIAWIEAPAGRGATAYLVPVAGGSPRRLTDPAREKASGVAWTGDGRLALTVIEGFQSRIELVAGAPGSPWLTLSSGALAVIPGSLSWAHAAEPYGVVGSSAEHPPEVFWGQLPRPVPSTPDTVGAPPPPITRLTHSNPLVESLPRGRQALIRYPSSDGATRPAILVEPVVGTVAPRVAVLVIQNCVAEPLQDGWLSDYWRPTHAFAERGALVLLLEPTSPSASPSWEGEIESAVKWLVESRQIDSRRIGILHAGDGNPGEGALGRLAGLVPARDRPGAVIHSDCQLASRARQLETTRHLLDWFDALARP
ncbi:MAG: hypothetical protein KA385_02220 [Vicinamibacteria bacterium]|jgi:hypothetical protein|nr:hypothetical protein [Vicinamibacteria bacterium]